MSNAGYKNNNQIGVLNRAEGSNSKRRGSDDESFTKGGTQPPSLSPGGGSVLPLGFGMDDGALRRLDARTRWHAKIQTGASSR